MGTKKNNFAAVFVLHILMHTTIQSISSRGNSENSSKRNSLLNDATMLLRWTSPPSYECLFVDPDLPICDVKWMLDSAEDSTSSEDSYNIDVVHRSRRNVDVSAMDVIVYTFEGCLPSRIPFSMPSCEGISLDRIIDVQKFRPFAVKGVTKPPFVFPKFNYPQWLRMMTRLRNHVSSKIRDEQQHTSVSEEAFVDDSAQDRKEELMNAAMMKQMIPNMIAVSIKDSNGSSLISSDSKSAKLTGQILGTVEGELNARGIVPQARFPSESTTDPPSLQSRDQMSSMKLRSNEYHDHSRLNIATKELYPSTTIPAGPEIPAIPNDRYTYDQMAIEKPLNKLLRYYRLKKLLELPPVEQINITEDEIDDDYPFKKGFVDMYRRKREIGLSAAAQAIAEDSKARGIVGKSVARRIRLGEENSSSKTNQFACKKQKKQPKYLKIVEQGIAASDVAKNRIERNDVEEISKTHGVAVVQEPVMNES
ncbi:hypothetical protein WN48_09978 [Eufriesea mexicana]|uniref:Uncharacterized protein n=1 Tax=Eufriesea mexicana TaxID=516756 RepID=A0A310SDP9_9HYME|nr:hypothetical protein WN48_09978 [Eufriesea mexicana]